MPLEEAIYRQNAAALSVGITERGEPRDSLGLGVDPNTGDWERTFAITTVPSNELVGKIHNRMPAILEPKSYDRWLGPEPAPHDFMISYPSEPMMMWPISTRVNKPKNDDPSLLDRVELQR